MENAFSQMRQTERAGELGRSEPEITRQLEQIRQIARGTDDIIVVTPKEHQDMRTLQELHEELRSIDQHNRWLVLPYGIRIEHLSDEQLKRLGLQHIPGAAGHLAG